MSLCRGEGGGGESRGSQWSVPPVMLEGGHSGDLGGEGVREWNWGKVRGIFVWKRDAVWVLWGVERDWGGGGGGGAGQADTRAH